jgi:uncharacterized protein with HEPN domain
MQREDETRLMHMLDAAKEVAAAVKGRSRGDLDSDHVWALGLTKSLEIIGEAASRLSEETRDAIDGIPWADVIAMRNRLVHAYFDIDMDQVWATCTQDMYPLINALKSALRM